MKKQIAAAKSVKSSSKKVVAKKGLPASKGARPVAHASAATSTRIRELEAAVDAINASLAVIEFRMDGTVITANSVFLKTMGYELNEVVGKHHSMFVDEKYKSSWEYQDFWSKLNRCEFQTGEMKRIRKDGSVVWLQSKYNTIVDAKGQPIKVVKYASDVTENQLASNLKTAVDHVSTAIMMVDRNFVVNYVNHTTKTMLAKNERHFRSVWPSFNAEKILGTCIDIFHADPSHQRKMLADPKNLPHRTDISVGPLKFALCVNATVDASGNYIGNMLEWADVTEVRRQEVQNADYMGQIQAISRASGIIEFTMEGMILNANDNFLNLMGYTLDEIKGKHHSIFVSEADRRSVDYREFWTALQRGEFQAAEYKRIGRGGREIWIRASYNPIPDMAGKPFKVVKYATDVSAIKRKEEQLALAMAETGRVMREVAGGNLDAQIQGAFEGEFAELRDCVNGCVDFLRRMMSEAGRVMLAVAAGDLQDQMEGTFEGAFGELRNSVNSCVERLRETIERIRNAMSTMTVSATEIASGNLDLSQRTEEQAASLATTAANMEELTATVKQNADCAREANGLASSARQHAERGGLVVTNAISAMSAINEASKRIADIISVIDDIAFQTNLLALNAAVEAARAGEQGRGFAVVASEVRNLAQRSAGAAKEIKGLIKDSVGRVDEGSRLVNESGATLEQIVTAAKKVSDIVAEIAAASSEQSLGIEKVAEAVQQMDIAVQQNSALVEETSAASSMMDDQARSVSSLVEFFKLSDHDESFSAMPRKDSSLKGKAFGNPKTTQGRPVARIQPKAITAKRSEAIEFASAEEF